MESNPQFGLENALRGLFLEKNFYIGSPMFWGIKTVLTGQKSMTDSFIPSGGLPLSMREYFKARHIDDDIQTLMECNKGQAYSDSDAEMLAADLVNRWLGGLSLGELDHYYFNIKDPSYYSSQLENLGFANNAVDLIIGSTYDLIAALYGAKILVLEDKRNRGLDLAHFNYVKNNLFFDHWADNGEVDFPAYVKGEEIVGFQQRDRDRPPRGSAWSEGIPQAHIKYAFYRHSFKGQNIVLVIDGSNSLCVAKGPDQKYYFCANYWDSGLMSRPVPFPAPRSTDKKDLAPLYGVITNCGKKNCPSVDEISKWYGKGSTQSLDPAVVTKIEKINVDGNTLSYIPHTLPVQFSGIKVISASYVTAAEASKGLRGNVTDKAAAFCNGKDEIDYKVSHRFLGIPADKEARSFEIKWACDGDLKSIHTKSIPANAEGTVFKMDCK
jgi:hypothetical protein